MSVTGRVWRLRLNPSVMKPRLSAQEKRDKLAAEMRAKYMTPLRIAATERAKKQWAAKAMQPLGVLDGAKVDLWGGEREELS